MMGLDFEGCLEDFARFGKGRSVGDQFARVFLRNLHFRFDGSELNCGFCDFARVFSSISADLVAGTLKHYFFLVFSR